jgi:hypothetical protein
MRMSCGVSVPETAKLEAALTVTQIPSPGLTQKQLPQQPASGGAGVSASAVHAAVEQV